MCEHQPVAPAKSLNNIDRFFLFVVVVFSVRLQS